MRSKMRPPNDVIESKCYRGKMPRLVLIGFKIGEALAHEMLEKGGLL